MSSIVSKTKKALVGGLAALTLGGAMIASSAPAQAQFYGGYGHGFRHGGYYGGGFARPVGFHGGYGRPVGFYGHRYARPVGFYGPRAYGYGPRYYRRGYNGGAVAAGLVGGLALGALATNAYRPAYYGGYGVPVASECVVQRRRVVDDFGRVFVQRERVCY
ncbi:MAG TPA: hypothetical protein VIL65_02430 [Beijerinckiaceae bacterium]|jgi:hypothetical protein